MPPSLVLVARSKTSKLREDPPKQQLVGGEERQTKTASSQSNYRVVVKRMRKFLDRARAEFSQFIVCARFFVRWSRRRRR